MASEITIVKIPSEIVSPHEFAALERVSIATVRRWTTGDNPCIQSSRESLSPVVNVQAAWFAFTTRAGKKSSCVRRWGIPVFNSLLALDSLYVNCKDATC